MNIVCLSGEKGHGKDTISDYIVNTYGYSKLAFATYLKEIVGCMFSGINKYEKDEDFTKPIEITYGNILRFLNKFYDDNTTYNSSFEVTLNIINKFHEKRKFTSLRDMYQFIGTEIIRDIIDDNFHIKKLLNNISSKDRVVISDCRFPNEREALRRLYRRGKEIIFIKVMRRNVASPQAMHLSETSFGDDDEYDYIIYNDEGLKELYDKVEIIFS